jgi:glycosyltransferase involved in cell wall biosynthesis
MKTPRVTVLMPVFNGEKYLKEAIDSILKQKFHDFEFLIINDGSTDGTSKIIASYNDLRIRVIDNGKNLGLVHSLNKGLDIASGEYIARMDCDDISVDRRLSVQVKFMDAHKNTGACGSYYYLVRGRKKAIVDLPLSEKEIKCFLLFNSPVAHPAAIIRNHVLQKYNLRYSSEFMHAEDYDFWSRVARYAGLANISKPLLFYRVHDNQITGDIHAAKKKRQSVSAVRMRNLREAGIDTSKEELAIHNLISDGAVPLTMEEVNAAEEWLKKLICINKTGNSIDKYFFQKIVMERWLRVCFNFFHGKKAVNYFLSSDLYAMINLPVKRKLELVKNLYYSWKRLSIKK